MTHPTMTTTRELGRCPACGKPFTARVQMSVELTDYPAAEGDVLPQLPKTATATARMVGLELSHDCMRKATR